MSLKPIVTLFAVTCWLPPGTSLAAQSTGEARLLRVAVVQFGLEPTLQENRDKIVRLTKKAAATGARVVVFPEGALASPPGTPRAEVRAAVTDVGQAARDHGAQL